MAGMDASRRSWLVLAAVLLAYAVYLVAYLTHASGLLRYPVVKVCVYVFAVWSNLLAVGACAYGGRDTTKRRLPDWLCITCILLPVAFVLLDTSLNRLGSTAAISRSGGYAAIVKDCRKLLQKGSELGMTDETSSFYYNLITPDLPSMSRLREYGWSFYVWPSDNVIEMKRDRRDPMLYHYNDQSGRWVLERFNRVVYEESAPGDE